MIKQGLVSGADAIVPGAGTALSIGSQITDKLKKEDCEIDPVTGKEVCVDKTNILGNVLGNPLDASANAISKLVKGDLKGLVMDNPIAKILGVKDSANEAKLEEIRKQLQRQKEAQINKSNQAGINQGLMT